MLIVIFYFSTRDVMTTIVDGDTALNLHFRTASRSKTCFNHITLGIMTS